MVPTVENLNICYEAKNKANKFTTKSFYINFKKMSFCYITLSTCIFSNKMVRKVNKRAVQWHFKKTKARKF